MSNVIDMNKLLAEHGVEFLDEKDYPSFLLEMSELELYVDEMSPFDAVKFVYHGSDFGGGKFNPYCGWYTGGRNGYPMSVADADIPAFLKNIVDIGAFSVWCSEKGYVK